eukprot:1156573-Pelagomonas_calceolata.AAC.3
MPFPCAIVPVFVLFETSTITSSLFDYSTEESFPWLYRFFYFEVRNEEFVIFLSKTRIIRITSFLRIWTSLVWTSRLSSQTTLLKAKTPCKPYEVSSGYGEVRLILVDLKFKNATEESWPCFLGVFWLPLWLPSDGNSSLLKKPDSLSSLSSSLRCAQPWQAQ